MPELLASQATIGHAHASRAWERTKRKQDAHHDGPIGGFIMIYTLFFCGGCGRTAALVAHVNLLIAALKVPHSAAHTRCHTHTHTHTRLPAANQSRVNSFGNGGGG